MSVVRIFQIAKELRSKEKNLKLSKMFQGAAVKGAEDTPTIGAPVINDEQSEAKERTQKISGEIFLEISAWARETENLQPYQRGILYSVGNRLKREQDISGKQAVQVMKAYDEAIDLGFKSQLEDG